MSLNQQIPFRRNVKLISERALSDDEKLKVSLAYRAREKKMLIPDELGTPENRPRRGLICDAPLGLKS